MHALVRETIVVPARVEELPAVHEALDRFWSAVDSATAAPPRAEWRHRFATAVIEIAANIVRHAHPPGAPPDVLRLQLRFFAGQAVARFTDHGLAFRGVATTPPAPPTDPADIPEGGYGLRVARALLDRLEYRRTRGQTNVWRLIKRDG